MTGLPNLGQYQYEGVRQGANDRVERRACQNAWGGRTEGRGAPGEQLDQTTRKICVTFLTFFSQVLANKQDLPQALSPAEVTEKLGLPRLSGRKWYIQVGFS